MRERISIKNWIERFNNGDFENPDYNTQCNAGWFDWFCNDTSLKRKTKKMGNIIKKITNEKILNEMYVFFKNNCPMAHPLYDQFNFCDLNNRDVGYCVDIDCRFHTFKYVVFEYKNGFDDTIVLKTDNKKELIDFFNNL